jgi:hypothetical protein
VSSGGWKSAATTTSSHQEPEDESAASSPSRALGPPSLCATPPINRSSTPRDTPPISVKDPARLVAAAAAAASNDSAAAAAAAASLNKAATAAYHFTSALAAAGHHQPKFPAFFHHPGMPNGGSGDPAADLYAHLASPNLFNALKRKYPIALGQKPSVGGFVVDPDSPVLKMPFLKDYFAKHPLDLSDAARSAYANSLKEEDDIAERQSPSVGETSSVAGDLAAEDTKPDIGGGGCGNETKQGSGGLERGSGGGGRKPQGRGSRLERMIAAEYKILSEYSDPANGGAPEALPAITPELMKSRRTHSLQLAIGEILHNRASVQSAATKYHIPRETLRRHYQRYLKAMGINNKEMSPAAAVGGGSGGAGGRHGTATNNATPTKSSIETLAAAAALAGGGDEGSNYSSLLDIGQAYGLWNPGEDNSNDMSGPRDLKIVEEEEEDEEEEEEDDDEEAHSDDKENEEETRVSQVGFCRLTYLHCRASSYNTMFR